MSDPLPHLRERALPARPSVRATIPTPHAVAQRSTVDREANLEEAGRTINRGSGPAPSFHLPAGGVSLGREIGRGGLGLVREAEQRVFGRTVAVKTLHRRQADPQALAGFYAEAVATAALQHPHIVPIIDLVEHDGELRLLMKRVEGVTWHALLHPRSEHEKELSARHGLEEHLEILGKIIDAVAFAHSRGVLHRDLKPANVMVGGYGEVLLMDWGCAVTYGDHVIPGIQAVASTTAITGSPAYLAPEMARPDPARIGPASDVYLLGGILYEILTGQRPHSGSSVSEIIRAAARGEIVPPGERAPDRRIPRELAGLAMLCLNPDISRRPAGAEEVAARLKRYFRHRDALRLAEQGRRLADQAGEDLETWGRAVAFADQALEIWPRSPDARQLRLDAGLHYAQAACKRGSFALAAAQAEQVQRVAGEWKLSEPAKKAGDLAVRAAEQERTVATRERQVARLRAVTRIAVTAVVLVSLVLGTISGVAYLRMRQAQEEHAATQRQAAPAWISRASAQLEQGDLNEAAVFVDLAVRFNPESAPAHLLAAELAFLKGDLATAAQSLQSAERHGQAGLEPLRQTLAALPAKDLSGPQRDTLAKDLARCGLDRAARGFLTDRGKRLEMYRERLAKTLGRDPRSLASALTMDESGAVKVALSGNGLKDLGCLEGMPVVELAISNCQTLTSLASLRGLPLRHLSLCAVPVSDLTPLVGMQLDHLHLNAVQVTSIAPLRGLPLKTLVMVAMTGVDDWSPIADLRQLEKLTLPGGGPVDLAWLQGKAVKALDFNRIRLESVAVLRELKPEILNLSKVSLPAGSNLAGLSLTSVTGVGSTTEELDTLVGSRIQQLTLVQVKGDLKRLRRLKPDKLVFSNPAGPVSCADLVAIEPGRLELARSDRETELACLRGVAQGTIDGLLIADFFRTGDIVARISGQPCDDRCLRQIVWTPEYGGGPIRSTITLRDLDLHDLRPLADLNPNCHLRLIGCRFGPHPPLLPSTPLKLIDISFCDISDPSPFIAIARDGFTFFGLPLGSTQRLRAGDGLEAKNPGLLLVANRTTLDALLKKCKIHDPGKLATWVPQYPDLAFYEVMRLELHEGRASALERLAQYQRCLSDPGTIETANRLRTTIEGRRLRK